jgi:GGDEF domain-containing protein
MAQGGTLTYEDVLDKHLPAQGGDDYDAVLSKYLPEKAPQGPMPEPSTEKHSALQRFTHAFAAASGKLFEGASRLTGNDPFAASQSGTAVLTGKPDAPRVPMTTPGAAEANAQQDFPISPGEENTPAAIVGGLGGAIAQTAIVGPAGLVPALSVESGMDHYDRAKAAGLPEAKAWEEAAGHTLITAGTLYGGGKAADILTAKVAGPILAKINTASGGFLANLLQRFGKGVATGAGFAGSGEAGLLVSKALDKHADKEDLQKLAGSSSDKREALVNGATGFIMAMLHAPQRPPSEIPSSGERETLPGEAKPADVPQEVALGQPAKEPLAPEAPSPAAEAPSPGAESPSSAPVAAPTPPEPEHPAVAQLAELKNLGESMDALETRSKWLRQRGRGGEAAPLDAQRIKLLMRQQELALEIQTGVATRAAAEQAGTPVPVERRLDREQRAAVEAMTPDEQKKALFTSEKTGLGNERAYKAAPKAGAVETSLDIDNLKLLNDKLGYEAGGDVAIRKLGEAIKAEAPDTSFHLHGDEFRLLHNDQASAEATVERIRARIEKEGFGISAGHGSTAKEADTALHADKAERLRTGKRVEPRPTESAPPAPEAPAGPDPREQLIRNIIEPPRPPKPPVDEAEMPEGPDRNWHTIYEKWVQDDATDKFMTRQNAANLEEEVKASMPQDFLSKQRGKMLAPGERPEDMLRAGMARSIDAGDKLDDAFGRTQDKLSQLTKAKLKAMANATPEQRAIAEKIRARGLWFGQNVAVEAGIIREAHDNFLHRMYEGGEGEQRPRGSAKFKTFTTSSLPRTFETILDAEAAGKKLLIDDAIKMQAQLEIEILDVKNNRNLIKGGRKAGILRFTETDPKEVEAAAETGAEPEKYKLIENPRFRDWKTVAKVELAEPDPETLQKNLSNAMGEDVPKDEAIKIYGWSKDMLRKNPASGETESLGVLGKDVMIRADGTILMKKPLYAPAEMADKINLQLKSHQYMQGPMGTLGRNVDVAQNAVKSGLLKAPVLHYAKVTLDFMLGADLADWKDLNPKTAYKRGWDAMAAQEPNLRMLVAGSLKLEPSSEWTDAIHQHQTWIGNGIDKLAARGTISMASRNWLKNTLQDQVDFLFHRYIPALKARSALTGLDNDMVRNADKIASGQITRQEVIAGRARNGNTLLGDLNLQRLGRDPETQKWLNRLLFSPTWFESGIRKATEAFESGAVGEANRQMWKNVMKRYAATWVAGNIAAAVMEDPRHPKDQALKNLQAQYGAGLRAMLGVDITPELALLGRKNPNRFYIGIAGSFADTAKAASAVANTAGMLGVPMPKGMNKEALQLLEDKMNVVGRAAIMAMAGQDPRGQPVTSIYEATGMDDKGPYKTTQIGKHLAGQPKGGKLAGEWTSYRSSEKPGPISPEQYGPFAAYQLEHTLPIHVQGLIDSITGQMDWWHTVLASLGTQPVEQTNAQRKAIGQ